MSRLLKSVGPIPIAFGGGAISGEGGGYGFGQVSEEKAIDLLHYAFDRGLRVFDTAPIYGFGLSEIRIGKAFKGKREKTFLISKSGVTWDTNKRVNMTNDPRVTQKMLEQSLKDLQTEYIDLFFIHWPDTNVDIRKPMEVLSKAKREGKIRHIGLSNTTKEEIEKAQEIDGIEVVQSEFNFFNRQILDLLPYLKKNLISFMSWGTFDKGILSGTVDEKRTFDKVDARSTAPWWKKQDKPAKFEQVRRLRAQLEEDGIDLVTFALGFNLSHPGVDITLCGMKTREQVDSVLDALEKIPKDAEFFKKF